MNLLITILLTAILGVGDFATWIQGNDTLLIFRDEIELRTEDDTKMVDWYTRDASGQQSWGTASSKIFSSATSVEICRVGETVPFAVRHVFTLSDYLPLITSLVVNPLCKATEITVTGSIPPMVCYTAGGSRSYTLPWQSSFSYDGLTWSEEAESWVDTVCVTDVQPLAIGTYRNIPPYYQQTSFLLRWQPDLTEAWTSALADSIRSDVFPAVAVAFHPTAEVMTRGSEQENEKDRPVDGGKTISRENKLSGPLNVLFRANATPMTQYYLWQVKMSETLLATRRDDQQRYIFSEPNVYSITVSASNDHCLCTESEESGDSIFYVNIGSSLLRVPNVFTPNGDGVNDEFRVLYESIRDFHCWIYDRWGHLVYDWDDPAKGWDGTVNGRPAAVGAYYYVIRAMGTDAPKGAKYGTKMQYQKSHPIGVYRLSGDINLLR